MVDVIGIEPTTSSAHIGAKCAPRPQLRRSFGSQSKSFHKKSPDKQDSFNGGRDRDRTDDLLVANEALSQLSYTPDKSVYGTAVTRTYLL